MFADDIVDAEFYIIFRRHGISFLRISYILLTDFFKFNLLIADDIVDAEFYIIFRRHGISFLRISHILLTDFFKFNLLIADDIAEAGFHILIGKHGNVDLTHLILLTDLRLLIQPIIC